MKRCQVNEYQDPGNYSTSKATSGNSVYTMLNREKELMFSASRLPPCTDTVYHCLKSANFQKQTRTVKHSCFIKVIQRDMENTGILVHKSMMMSLNVPLI